MGKLIPRSVRNNNPGNIEHSPNNKWVGILPMDRRNDMQLKETRFEVFESPVYGFRALALLMQAYQDRYNCLSVRDIINRWAPPVENDTGAYVNAVAAFIGVRADDPIDVAQYDYMRPLVQAIACHEPGAGYNWSAKYIDEGLRRAGVINHPRVVSKVPVTKESVAASGVGMLGIGQFADVAPQINDALTQAGATISNGTWVQMIFAGLTLTLAVYIAYAQVKKHQAGLE